MSSGGRTTAPLRGPNGIRPSPRKIDAERFLATVENAKNTGTFVGPALSRITVGEWAQRWLNGQTQLKPTTR